MPNDAEIKKIESIDDFVQLILAWHHNSMSQLDALSQIPENQEMTIDIGDADVEEDIVLNGDLHKGFRIGVIVAMDIFNKLPFVAKETTDDTPTTGD